MDATRLYLCSTSLLLSLQAILLLLTPSSIIWLLSATPRTPTAIESLLSRSSGLALLVLAFLHLVLSGEVRRVLAASVRDEQASSIDDTFAGPTLVASLFYHVCASVMQYVYSNGGDGRSELAGLWLTVGSSAHMLLAGAAVLLLLFGRSAGHVSRRTGADKRTSGFPFKNAEADKKRIKTR